MKESFPKGKYADVLGLCKVATITEIEAQGWSLNPGRYVGVAERAADDFEFAVRLEELNEELETSEHRSEGVGRANCGEYDSCSGDAATMSDWTNMKLGEVAEFLNGGAWSADEYAESGIPVVRVSDIKNETVVVSDDRKFLPSHLLNRYQKNLLQEGDVVVATVGSHPTQPASVVGRAARIPRHAHGNLLNQNAVCIRPIDDRLVRDYLRYVVVTPPFKQYVAANARGSANQVRMAISSLANMPLALPTPSVQRRVSDILSGYDDLIENNTRRIKILEDLAQMLYREWFVNFRFPGPEKVRMVESELGPIPEGWVAIQLERVLDHVIGGGWGEELQSDEFRVPAYVVRGTDIPGARHGSVTNCPLRWHKESNFRSRKLHAGDLVFEVSGGSKGQPVGRSLLVGQTLLSQWDREVICASFCKLLRPKTGLSSALYCFLAEAYTNGVIEKYQVQSTGISNFKFTAFVSEVRMPMPTTSVMSRFEAVVTPMLDAIAVFGKRNANLRTTRDFLLPKLISGEIPVEAAAELVEQAV